MIYRFIIASSEKENFVREIHINSDATFLDLHKAILNATGYKEIQTICFYICDEEWNPHTQVPLIDNGTSKSYEDIYLMEKTKLDELLEEEKQRLTYLFDPTEKRLLYIELSEIILGKNLDKAICYRSIGQAPLQKINIEEHINKNPKNSNETYNEDFYGSDDFDEEEFDPEGFEIIEGN